MTIEELKSQVKKFPKDMRLRLKLADAYLSSQKKAEAISQYFIIAEYYTKETLSSWAIAVYKKILSIEPGNLNVLTKMGDLYFTENLFGDARSCYEQVLKLNPNESLAWDVIGRIEVFAQVDELIAYCEKRLQEFPEAFDLESKYRADHPEELTIDPRKGVVYGKHI